ncbi:MAG: aminopeptidase N [Arachnia sp.]
MGANLTREETGARAAAIHIDQQRVSVDVCDAADLSQPTYPVDTTIALTASEPDTWLDYQGDAVTAVLVDGKPRPIEFDGSRIRLRGLPTGVPCVIDVQGASRYSRSGEGMHRFRDPADGQTYLYTQYEPADARRVFPCFEQPDIKPHFTFELIGPSGWQLLSNQPEVSRRHVGNGMDHVTFAPTPPLSTYLTCLVAGPYHRVDDVWASPKGDVELAWMCRASLAPHLDADELTRITIAGLDYLDTAFGDYVWGKYHQILVPEYNLGAMENPGLVTYTEGYVFRSPATPAQHQARSNTILHEMSHMWFGDLVTPRWWSDLWLKESFAEFMGAHLSKEAAGFEDAWLNFTGGRKASAHVADSMPTTHPIVADIPDLEAAKNNFDAITYSKGASALTQLVHYVGLEPFFAGCRLYFQRHAFGNATLTDFLAALTETSGRDLQSWADAWLLTRGHDEVAAEVTAVDGLVEGLVIRRGPGPMGERTRPHATTLGLYDIVDNVLRLRARHDVTLDSDATPVAAAVGQAVPAVILPNDTDQTFVRVRLDAGSRRGLLAHISHLEPLVRATSWAALFADVRDAVLPVREYVNAVIEHAPLEDRTGTLAALIGGVEDALQRFAPADVDLAQRWRDTCRSVAENSGHGSMRQLQWAKAHIRAAALAPSDVTWILEGTLPGLEVTDDLRWLAWQSLAVQGRATPDDLDVALTGDDTAAGRVAHLRAWYSRPEAALKQEAWDRAHVVDGETNADVDALLDGIFAPGQDRLTEVFAEPYFASLLDVWRDHPIEIARRLVLGGFPTDVSHLRLATTWLDENPTAPPALRRLVLEGRFELDVAARVRTAQR